MRRVSHRMIGRFVVENMMRESKWYYKWAFKFGNSIPDYNGFSYLRGWKMEHFRGHNYPNSQVYLEKLVNNIRKKYSCRFIRYFKLGMLVHYVTDAFTHTHNKQFKGGMREHHAYEERLHRYFIDFLKEMEGSANIRIKGDVLDIINKGHDEYECEEVGIETDAEYIFKMVNVVVGKMKGYIVD